MKQEALLILGGGIAGLTTALALAKIGVPALVIEQAKEFREIGAGIQLGPNGYRALKSLGLETEAMALGVFPDELVFMNSMTGSRITSIPTGEAFRERFEFPYTLIHRADLHATLLRAARNCDLIDLVTSAKVDDIIEGSPITVRVSDGRRFTGSALIGADGLWSRTRQLVVGDGPPVISGHIAYRAVLPTESVPEQYRENAMILWGGKRHHLVQYPLRGGELFNLVAVFHSDKFVEGWDTTGDAVELQRKFADACEPVQSLLSKIDAWRMWVLCDREPVRNWSKHNVTLVGDAAHPMLQYLAQGACMAMEDAVVLARSIAQTPGDLPKAFQHYQKQRYLRTGKCQVMARVYGEFYHADGVRAEMRDMMLSARSAEQSYADLEWLYQSNAFPH